MMKYKRVIAAVAASVMMCAAFSSVAPAQDNLTKLSPVSIIVPLEASAASVSVSGSVHLQDIGNKTCSGFDTIWGTTGQSRRLEKINLNISGMSGTVTLQTHCQNIGWQSTMSASTGKTVSGGTEGRGLAVEAFKINLSGDIAKSYSIYYIAHCADTGWTQNGGYRKDSEVAGSTGQNRRCEALIISLQPKATTTKYVNTSSSPLNIWLQRGNKSVKLCEIPRGSAVQVHQTVSGWAFVDYTSNGTRYSGWVDAQYLSNTKPATTAVAYRQSDSRWGSYQYGYSNKACTQKATISSGGCGLLAYTNAVYALNGQFIDPRTLADYSVKNGYRVNGVGTSHGLYAAFAKSNGAKYGIASSGTTSNYTTLRNHLNSGGVAVASATGHLMAVVAYNPSTKRYLVLDSAPSSTRGTQNNGTAWLTESQINNNAKLKFSSFMMLKKR